MGTFAATTSKGADEQSSRRTPGSHVDPGVCFCNRQGFGRNQRLGCVFAKCAALRIKEDAMPKRMMFALFLATVAVGPATAQQAERGGVRTETASRLAGENSDHDMIWNVIGLLGLFGLIGLVPRHEEDSYHPSPVE
jgi:hypothetical protein